MELKAGDVVVLKSGGQPLTVASVDGEAIECVWIGEEGDLFRETLLAITLERAEIVADEGDDEPAHANGDEDEEEEDDARAVA